MIDICPGCGAVNEACCATAKARQDTATTLAQIVARQSDKIRVLTRERDEALQVVQDLRPKAVA